MSSSSHSYSYRAKYQRGDSDLVTIFIMFLIVLVLAIVVMLWSGKKFLVKEKDWSAVQSVTTDARMGEFHFIAEEKYDEDKWSYTELSSGDVLINPFEMHLLCHIKSIPNPMSLVNEASTRDIIQAKQNHDSLIVKPIAVAWQDNDDMLQRAKSCPDVDSSGQFILYRGHRVVELLGIVSTNQAKPSISEMGKDVK